MSVNTSAAGLAVSRRALCLQAAPLIIIALDRLLVPILANLNIYKIQRAASSETRNQIRSCVTFGHTTVSGKWKWAFLLWKLPVCWQLLHIIVTYCEACEKVMHWNNSRRHTRFLDGLCTLCRWNGCFIRQQGEYWAGGAHYQRLGEGLAPLQGWMLTTASNEENDQK